MTDFARARGIRIAFLLANGPSSAALLDAVFSLACGFYGGRFSLLVPCEGGEISPRYWKWLRAYDPDLIYSFVPIDQDLEQKIHETCYPSYLVEHFEPGQQENRYSGLWYRLPIAPLSSLSLLPTAAKVDPLSPQSPTKLIDRWPGAPLDRFLLDNFGFQSDAEGRWTRYSPASQIAGRLSFAPAELREDPRTGPRDEDDTYPDVPSLLLRMQTERIVGVAQLAALEARRLEYRSSSSWEDRFHIFVGDEYRDRVGFWNARHLQPGWLDQSFVSARLSPADLESPDFESTFSDFVQRRAGRVLTTRSGSAEVKLVSLSLTREQLEPFRQRLAERDKRNRYTAERIDSLDACGPTDDALAHAIELEGGRYPISAGTPWTPMTRVGHRLFPPRVAPQHVALIPAEHRTLRGGLWAVDCEIERSNNLSRFSNVCEVWRLPRRLRIAHSFAEPVQSEIYGGRPLTPRVSRAGALTVFGGDEGVPFEIIEPDDSEALHRSLVAGRRWFTEGRTQRPSAEEIAAFARTSNSGRYVQGLIQLFGGLNEAAEYLLHPFWMARFEELGASVRSHKLLLESVSNRLRKRQHSGSGRHFDLRDQADSDYLAEIAIRYSSQEKRSLRYLTFEKFLGHYEAYRAAHEKRHPPIEQPDTEWRERERATLDKSIQYLCQRGVLHQGYEWTCQACLHRNWVGIERLERQLECSICGRKQPPTVADPWAFRLSEFVVSAIKDYGVLPVVWCLQSLREQVQTSSFYYLPPTALFYDSNATRNGTPDAEVDLLVVVNGRVSLCEAKSSDRDVDAEKLALLASRLRPDEVVIAAMTQETQRLRDALGAARARLASVPAEVRLLTLDEGFDDHYGGTWLPSFEK